MISYIYIYNVHILYIYTYLYFIWNMIYNVYIYRFMICIWIVYDIEKIWYKPKTRTIYIKNTWYAVDISVVHGQEKGYERCYRFACPFSFAVEQKMHWSTKRHHPPFEVRAFWSTNKKSVGCFPGGEIPKRIETRICWNSDCYAQQNNLGPLTQHFITNLAESGPLQSCRIC